jgi:hypothetical protein
VWRAADPIISVVLDRFGRPGIPVNNAGVFIAKPLTDYTTVWVNLAGFFWFTERAIVEMVSRYGGHVVNVSATIAEVANSGRLLVLAALPKRPRPLGRWPSGTPPRLLVNAVASGVIQTTVRAANSYQGLGGRLPSPGRAGPVSDVVDGVLLLESFAVLARRDAAYRRAQRRLIAGH